MDRRDFLITSAATSAFLASKPSLAQGSGTVRSITAMTFAADGKLVVADWKGDALHSLALPSLPAAQSGSFNIRALDTVIAEAEGLDSHQILATAAIFDPRSGRAVVAYHAGKAPDAPARLAMIAADGATEILDPSAIADNTLILDAGIPDVAFWDRTPTRSFMVTDIKSHGDELIVAGLANADFSSTLRRIPYPFSGQVHSTEVEMYHTVHNQIETRAPVRAFAVVSLDGKDHLLAAYTCTPLVTAPLEDISNGATVRAKTIAELGFGNTPLDIVPFEIEYDGQKSSWVIVANAAKSADLISLDAIAAANRSEGISTPVKVPFQTTAGPAGIQMPLTNLLRLVDQDPQFLLALRRDPAQGDLHLVSFRKGAFFRLSDFVNEYDFPNYDYPADDQFQQDYIRPFHAMMKSDEGFPHLVE